MAIDRLEDAFSKSAAAILFEDSAFGTLAHR
jgi:hypothetical protein